MGIHRRGAHLATRLHRLVSDLLDAEIAHGEIDIAFYRDDLATRGADASPVVHASHLPFRLEDHTVVLVDDVLFTGRTVRAGIEALFDYGRPARVQLAVLADRGHRELPIRPDYVGKNLPTARSERVNVLRRGDRRARRSDHLDRHGGPRMRHLLSIEDLDRPGIERILDRAKSFTEVSEREVKKVPALRGRRVLNLFYEASTRTRSSFELAAKTLSAEVINFVSSGSSVEKGESLKDTVQTLSRLPARPDRHPHAARRRRRARRRLGRRRGRQRRRRQARAPHAGAARRLHAARAARLARRRERSGSSATSCTRASRARTSSPSPSSAPRSRSAGRRR